LNLIYLFHILGSYGYRGPGSDYGDHSNQRRVSGSWYGDSGDDASETSSICSERSLEVCFQILVRLRSSLLILVKIC
jgi:hypothetical protein